MHAMATASVVTADPVMAAALAQLQTDGSVADPPSALVERRQTQLAGAHAKLHALNCEIDLYARKMMQLQQLAEAQQARTDTMPLAQQVARALGTDGADASSVLF